MAIIDYAAVKRQRDEKEAMEWLKNYLRESDKIAALSVLNGLERKIQEQEKELKGYKDFFIQMSKFLPRRNNNPVLG